MKICTKCGQEKPLSAYYYDKSKADKKHPECKSCFNQRMRETRKMSAYKIRFNPYQKEWQRIYRRTPKYKAWRKIALDKLSIKRQELKRQIVDYYGGKCNCCGVLELCFLSIDHINNDGYKLRENRKYRDYGIYYYRKIIAENYPSNLQILCFNCNIAKNHNGGECSHKTNAIICDYNE